MDRATLEGKVAVVTGGGRGMGRAIANALAVEGADIAIVERMPDHLEEVEAEIQARGRRAMLVEADITEVGALPGIFRSIAAQLGGIDVLMNNAGVSPGAPALETTEELWDLAMDVNAKALFFCALEAGRHFLEHDKPGKIINTCSTLSIIAEPSCAAYCASKGAVLQITRALSCEWAQHRINVNGIGPTMIETEMTEAEFSDAGYVREFMRKIPADVLPSVSHIADAAVFLAGPGSDFIHGHMLAVDSGELAV